MHCIGASLSESHIDHDNGPRAQNNGMYLCTYVSFAPRLSHPGSQDPCTPWNAPCIPVYWCALVRDLQLHLTEHQGRLELLVSAMKIINDRWMHNLTHGINCAFHLLRQWSCSCLATCQCACVILNQKWWLMGWLYCCFVTFTLTKAWHWTYYNACVLFVDVEPYRLIVLRHHWHCCICTCSCHKMYIHVL